MSCPNKAFFHRTSYSTRMERKKGYPSAERLTNFHAEVSALGCDIDVKMGVNNINTCIDVVVRIGKEKKHMP